MPKWHVCGGAFWTLQPFNVVIRGRTAWHWQFRLDPHLAPEQAILKKPALKWEKTARITWAAPSSLLRARKICCCKKTTLWLEKKLFLNSNQVRLLYQSPTQEPAPGLARPWALLFSPALLSPDTVGCTGETQQTSALPYPRLTKTNANRNTTRQWSSQVLGALSIHLFVSFQILTS